MSSPVLNILNLCKINSEATKGKNAEQMSKSTSVTTMGDADDSKTPSEAFDQESEKDLDTYVPGGDLPENVNDQNRRIIDSYLKDKINSATWQENSSVVDDRDVDTPDKWIPRHKDLVRLTGRHPFNCEAPLGKLFAKGFITPTSLHYVRNHGPPPKSTWHDHIIHLGGLAPNKLSIKMEDILKLPMHSLPVTLVCCGNRRKEQNMIKQTIGFNWGAGGVSTGVWTGVRLSSILKLAGIHSLDDFDDCENLFIRFASEEDKGGDKLPAGIYGTSVPLSKALDDSQDILVAFAYNGKLLTVDHGFPVRLIIPGYIGGRMIKWMTNIDLIRGESQDYYHFYDNKVLPSHVDAETAKAEDWWHRDEYICNDLSINSAIACPDHNETITVSTNVEEQDTATYKLQGYAYTGGGKRITRAEISLTAGATWKFGTIHRYEKPTKHSKYWCWIFWECTVTHKELLNAKEIVCRCWDESQNVQPDKPTWNVMGMLNNPWFRIKIHESIVVSDTDAGECIQLKFEHPTLAGNQNGGWMMKMKEHPSLTAPGIYIDPSASSTTGGNVDNASITTVVHDKEVKTAVEAVRDSGPSYTLGEVKLHNTPESAWIIVNNKVYDSTPFLNLHPGGSDSIMINAGKDCTEEFEAIHSKNAWKMLDEYYIGQLRPSDDDDAAASADESDDTDIIDENGNMIALNPKRRIPFKVLERIVLSPDSLLLRFGLQSPKHVLGLPVGQHMLFSAKIDDKLVMRAYTPTSSDYDVGHFDLVIKVYYANVNPSYPAGGKMSQYMNQLKVGDSIDVKGPLGHVVYKGNGLLSLNHNLHPVNKFAMLCAGTGITPIYQVICDILRRDDDRTEVFVIYSNRYEEDVLLKPELDALLSTHPGRLHIHYMLSKPREPEKLLSKDCIGRINMEVIAKYLPHGGGSALADVSTNGTDSVVARNFALLCGPDGFIEEACNPALYAHGYGKDQCVYF